MTFLNTVLLGAGVLLLASGLDGSSLKDTFQKVISGQTIDWSGGGSNSTPTPVNGKCPAGWTLFNDTCVKLSS